MEATLRPYDRGEEVTPFATLGLYHALPCPTILRLSPLFCCSYPKTAPVKGRLRGARR